MEQELTVILVEDDEEACNNYKMCIDAVPNMRLSAVTNSSIQAIDLVKEWLPDAIILDLELHEGQGTGLQFIQDLSTLDLPYKPYILISTNNSSRITYDYAREWGADFIMSKHKPGYSEDSVVELLSKMRITILSSHGTSKSELKKLESRDISRKSLQRLVQRELDTIGISPKAVGYRYLTDAIILVAEGETHNISTILGEKYHKSNGSIDRAMQNAIDRAWRTTDIDVLLHHYTARIQSSKGVPTLTEFIYYYAQKVETYR